MVRSAGNVFDTVNRLLQLNQLKVSQSLERLASGKRINRASDDAAGLQIVSQLSSQIRGSDAALGNIQQGVSLLEVAEGGLSTNHEALQRIRELTVQASSDTYSPEARAAIAQEISQLSQQIDATSQSTSFNGTQLLDGSANLDLQVGPNAGDTQNVTIDNAGTDLASGGIGLFDSGGGTTFTDAADLVANFDGATAQAFLSDIDAAMAANSQRITSVGVAQTSLHSTSNNLRIGIENTSAARARIQDVDVAKESAFLTQALVLRDASVAVQLQAQNSVKTYYSSFFG